MPCSRKEALVKLLFNVTSTVKFFFLFFYLFSLFFAKLFSFFFRTEDEYEDEVLYEDEDEDVPELEEDDEEEQEYVRYSHVEGDDLVADILNDGEALVFHPKDFHDNEDEDKDDHNNLSHVHSNSVESLFQDFDDEELSFESSPVSSGFDHHHYSDDVDEQVDYQVIKEDYTSRLKSYSDHKTSEFSHSKNNNTHVEFESRYEEDIPQKSDDREVKAFESKMNDPQSNYYHGGTDENKIEVGKEHTNFTRDEKFLIFAPPKSEARKLQDLQKENEVIFEDTYTVGSTSKSSSEWRSSIRDSGTDDPFSSSSRRSCPKWESYAVYQKYDEEMMFLDRISAQKLHETESLRSFQVEPRSVSQRIVHRLVNKKKRSSGDDIYKKNNPYNELEVAYVAQICLAWETLNWNYANFKRKQVSKMEDDHGCPAHVAQQFQQFQVLLQRYIENEPYERGKRPEIYTRMRGTVAPKLLQVPEYVDYEGEEKEVIGGRIASALFLKILEDAIQTFMNFLKADRESHCQVISALFKQRPGVSIDPTVLNLFKKHNKKKKLKLKELQRSRICLRKKKLTKEEEMEILMGLIDLKVVSRVLRMADITQEQLHWCEVKMGKLKLLDGKLHRDSSPLFFPAH